MARNDVRAQIGDRADDKIEHDHILIRHWPPVPLLTLHSGRNDSLATMYFALGIDPDMEIRNHLNQPRELVKGKVVSDLFA